MVTPGWSPREAIDNFSGFRELGVAGSAGRIEARSLGEWCGQAGRFGEEVIAKLG